MFVFCNRVCVGWSSLQVGLGFGYEVSLLRLLKLEWHLFKNLELNLLYIIINNFVFRNRLRERIL